MPVPTADSAVPIAVLVLAWDETTPAVRALVEATQVPAPTVESILVMVPQATNPDVLSAEEYLPLAPLPDLAPPPPTAPEPAALPPLPATEAAPEPPTAAATPNMLAESALPTPLRALPAPPPMPLPWTAVRVLHLGSMSLAGLSQRAGQPLPSLGWLSPPAAPAAPYLGATLAGAGVAPLAPAGPVALPAGAPAVVVELPAAEPSHPVLAVPQAPMAGARPLHYGPAELDTQQAALETDLPPTEAKELADEAEELAHFELAISELPTLLASFEVPFSAPQAGWPEALATLQQSEPAAPTPPPLAEAAVALGLPLLPVAAQYEALADLNFKVIQYARFAVPVALAEAPYDAIYAPAWPTWLAAQELRQRTGWPLVLHVTTLAAPADETLDTATGWMAELQRQALRRADVILAETPALAQRLRHELGLPTGTVHAVPAADAAAIAQALHAARPRPAASLP